MNPWLVYTDAVRLPTWFTCLMVGFALATFVLRREALRQGTDPRVVIDAALFVLPAALIGARALHVLIEAPYYATSPLDALSPSGGFVFYGGALAGLGTLFSFARARGVGLGELLDPFAVATALGLAFGRLGCLGGGCCFGRPADWPLGVEVPWSITYLRRGQLPDDALLGVHLHPAPLYELLFALALFVGLSRFAPRRPGDRALAFLALYGVGRAGIELFRADAERGVFLSGWITTSQAIGLATAALALALWRRP